MELAFFGAVTSVAALFNFRKEKEMKSTYETPEFNVIILNHIDIITTSGGNNGIPEDPGDNDGEWL